MIEHSHKQEEWRSIGQIVPSGSGWIIKDLLVRWNERQQTIEGPDGEYREYVYDTHYIDFPIPLELYYEMMPLEHDACMEALTFYLEQIKSSLISQSQNLVVQDSIFNEAL